MEWLDGESLEQRLARGVLSVGEALKIARTVADALAAAHAEGIIHRDLKPSNVFVTDDGAVKLLDFGVAKNLAVPGLTQTGQAIGTPGYMSPEQARGRPVDARADLFSLGCVIFRCLAGRRPFEGNDIVEFATKLALSDAPRLRTLAPAAPSSLDSLVGKLLEKEPARRPRSAAAVRDELARIASELVDGAAPTLPAAIAPDGGPSPLAPTPAAVEKRRLIEDVTPPSRSRAPLLLLAAMAVMGLAAGGWLLTREPPPPPPAAARAVPTSTTAAAAATSALAPPASASVQTTHIEAPAIGDAERAMLDRACHEWSAAIVRSQRKDGTFAANPQRAPTGLDTAMQLAALGAAERACGAVGATPLVSGVNALGRMHADDGWRGPSRTGSGEDLFGDSQATAWALLALERVTDADAGAKTSAPADLARADLVASRNGDDGGLRRRKSEKGPSTLPATILGAWALVDDPRADVAARDGALAWLRAQWLRRSRDVHQIGLAEQTALVLAHAAERGLRGQFDEEVLRAIAKEVVAHAKLEGVSCKQAPSEAGTVDVGEGVGVSVAWQPWATLAAIELSKEPLGPLDADVRGSLDAVAKCGIAVLRASLDVPAAPGQRLAENLLAASLLLQSRP
jgi:hypothetical protein